MDAKYIEAWRHSLGRKAHADAPMLWHRFMRMQHAAGKRWDKLLDANVAIDKWRCILSGEHPFVQAYILDDTHLAFVSVGPPWWTNDNWLSEQFYCRLTPGPSEPLVALENLARDLECKCIVFGTSLANDRALGRMLEARGYTPQSSQLIKDITWPHSPPSP